MNDAETIKGSLNQYYNLDVTSASMLRDGPDNFVWLLEARSGKKFVARASKRQKGGDIAFEAEWLKFLKEMKVPVVPIIESKTGHPFSKLQGGHAVTVFEFVSGKELRIDKDTQPPLDAVTSAARALALLHNISRGHSIAPPRHRTIYMELERALAHEQEIAEKVEGGRKFLQEIKEYITLKDSSAPVLVHNDYRINNILFNDNNDVTAILDFDWSCIGPAVKDVAHALAEWSLPDTATTHWENTFDNFLNSYNQVAYEKIANDDRLHQWIAFSCLSDACTYIVDCLERGEIKPVNSSYMFQKFIYFSSTNL